MTGATLPDGAPLCARHLHALRAALPDDSRALAPESRQFREALRQLVAATPLAVMLSRSELRAGAAYLRRVGAL